MKIMKNVQKVGRVIELNKSDVYRIGLNGHYLQILNFDLDMFERLDLLITYLGVQGYKGTAYLKYIIKVLLFENKNIIEAYEIVAQNYDEKNYERIERDIRYIKECFWNSTNIYHINMKNFLFGVCAKNKKITNSRFLLGIIQFLLTEYNINNDVENDSDCKSPIQVLENFVKDKNNFPVTKEKKEELMLFYWLLGRLAENLDEYRLDSFSVTILSRYLENGSVVLIYDKTNSTCCVSSKEVLQNVLNIFNDLMNYSVKLENDSLDKFTVYVSY